MKNRVAKLKDKIKAVRKLSARGGKGYFSNKNKEVKTPRLDDLARIRARNAARLKALEEQAMAGIVRGQRELEYLAA